MKPFADFASQAIHLLEPDIDTDQIVPARFLRTSDHEGLGRTLFFDRRFDADGRVNLDFPLNQPENQHKSILIAGENFGCGSSREHAPWALKDFGIRAVIAPSFGDIFYTNCLKNGLLAIALDPEAFRVLVATQKEIKVSLERLLLETEEASIPFAMDSFARYCLLNGLEEFDYLLKNEDLIKQFELDNQTAIRPIAGLV